MTQSDSKTPQADQLPGGRLMKAIVYAHYGPPDMLQLKEVAKPTLRDHEVLIRIDATTVTAADCELRNLTLPIWLRLPIRLYLGLIRPRNKILGQELAGEIEAVGKDVHPMEERRPGVCLDRFGFGDVCGVHLPA